MSGAKPRGLTLLATAVATAGVVTFASAASYLQQIYAFTSSLGLSPIGFPDFYSYFGILMAVGAAAVPVAYGVWRGERWGLTAGTYFSVAYMVFYVGFGSYFVATYGDYTELQAGLLYVVASGALVFYLERRSIRDYFLHGEAPLPVQDAAA
ncbi:MAG: hypothetical protein JRN21_04730 [Nitrososphaerota archaeon]|nr:hypothetical protein [Nitrososphaerota archaeon]